MTHLQTFALPDVGEGLTEADILGWRVQPGDDVTINQILVEIETAKAAVELPSPYAGRVTSLLVAAGDTVDVGAPIITIDTDPASAGPAADPAGAGSAASAVGALPDTAVEETGAKIGEMTADGKIATLVGYVSTHVASGRRPRKQPAAAPGGSAGPPPVVAPHSAAIGGAVKSPVPLASPPVRKLAKDLGVDLSTVTPTGADGVITRIDVVSAGAPNGGTATGVEAANGAAPSSAPTGAAPSSARTGAAPSSATTGSAAGYDPVTRQRRVPIKGVRKATAAAMVASAFTAPHVTVFHSVDVTELMLLRGRLKARPEFADVKLTPLTFAARAVCLALQRTPDLNAFWDEAAQEIVFQDYVHLGIAAATPRGLVVPHVRDADALDLHGLAVALTDLTETARAGKTSPAAMTGGTFTITNIGVFGIDAGTPIINPGESAILALGSIKDAPWVVDGALAVRKVCQLSLSFDHRVIDGAQGSTFLADVGSLLAEPGLAMAW